MNFAKQQLEKYGWKEGKGLGKNEDGISTALKVKLKFDKSGMGHDIGKQFTDKWWENVYNNALSNVEVRTTDDDVRLSLKNKDSVDVTTTTKSCSSKQDRKSEYGLFIRTSKLTSNGTEHFENVQASVPVIINDCKAGVVNDEELFAACGGRTAHKGARHGLKLSGKLSRIEKQERMLLKKLQSVSICDEKKDIEKKMKKIAKHKDKSKNCVSVEDGLSVLNLEDDSRSSGSSTTRKKKKKRGERKSVSFNETITEYHTQDFDTSTHSSDSNEASIVVTVIEKSQIKDEEANLNNNNNDDSNILDEGIEQDIEARSSPDCDHKSFEEAQCSNTEKLSKAERKLKKKIRATLQLLQEANVSELDKEVDAYYSCKKCMKRKHMDVEELEDGVYMKRYCNNQESSKKNKRKKLKEKKWKKKSQEQKINSITRSLDRMCNISPKK